MIDLADKTSRSDLHPGLGLQRHEGDLTQDVGRVVCGDEQSVWFPMVKGQGSRRTGDEKVVELIAVGVEVLAHAGHEGIGDVLLA